MKLGFDFDLAEKCERSYHYPIPEKENPMHKSEPHAQKPMLKSYTTEELIDEEFEAIASLFRVAAMCEHHAQIARNLNDPMAEDRYIEEANHALQSAYLLFTLAHK